MADQSLDELCSAITSLKNSQKKMKVHQEMLEAELLRRLDSAGVHTVTTSAGVKITKVTSQVSEWDLTILKDVLLPLGLWDQVTILKEELNREALETLLDRGQVEQEKLQPALTTKERRPYPRIT